MQIIWAPFSAFRSRFFANPFPMQKRASFKSGRASQLLKICLSNSINSQSIEISQNLLTCEKSKILTEHIAFANSKYLPYDNKKLCALCVKNSNRQTLQREFSIVQKLVFSPPYSGLIEINLAI